MHIMGWVFVKVCSKMFVKDVEVSVEMVMKNQSNETLFITLTKIAFNINIILKNFDGIFNVFLTIY